MPARGDRTAVAAFLIGSILAGANAVGIRFSNRELAPLWGAGLRFALAAAVLLVVLAVLRVPLPSGRSFTGAAVYGVLNFGGAFALAYYGLVHVHAGLGQTLLAVVPLATLLLAVLQRQERLHARAVVGALCAVAGIAVLSREPLAESVPPLAVLALLGGAVCFAQAAVVVRRFPPAHPMAVNAVAMGTGALLLLATSAIAGERIALPEQAATWVALAYLVVVGSVVVFVLYVLVLRFWDASRAAYTFVLVPVVTVVLSAWLDDEPLRGSLFLGGALVLGGVYVGALRAR